MAPPVCVVAVMVRQTPPHAWLTPQTKQPLLIGKPVLMDLLSQPRARELIRTPSQLMGYNNHSLYVWQMKLRAAKMKKSPIL